MLTGKIKNSDLHRLIYNALLYSNRHSSLGGDVLFQLSGDGSALTAVTSDDFVVLRDVAPVVGGAAGRTVIPQGSLKEFERALRAEPPDEEMPLELLHSDVGGLESSEGTLTQGLVLIVATAATSKPDVDEHKIDDDFAIHPDRLRKLSLIKPGGFPIDIRLIRKHTGEGSYQVLLGFKIGPTVQGVISTLSRPILEEKYSGEEIWR